MTTEPSLRNLVWEKIGCIYTVNYMIRLTRYCPLPYLPKINCGLLKANRFYLDYYIMFDTNLPNISDSDLAA